MEPILSPYSNRFTTFPIRYPDIWELYKKALASFWVVEEIELTQDYIDWNEKLNENERHFIKHILAFFAASDGIVNENLIVNFYNEITVPEIRQYYSTQILMESIHSEAYSLLIDSYIKGEYEKDILLNSIETVPIVKKKAEWAIKWITNGSFAEKLIAFSAVEGIFFSGSFCSIYWLKSRGLMPGLCLSNEFISRDEALHCTAAIAIYDKLVNKLSPEKIYNIYKEAVELECEFITESLPVSLIGMNSDMMKEYIKYIADYYLEQLNLEPLFKAKNPFPFMEYISIKSKTNFFEKKVSQYTKAKVGQNTEENSFSIDEDF
jgi:ribonucleoside-diphosphate reductase beta chain